MTELERESNRNNKVEQDRRKSERNRDIEMKTQREASMTPGSWFIHTLRQGEQGMFSNMFSSHSHNRPNGDEVVR